MTGRGGGRAAGDHARPALARHGLAAFAQCLGGLLDRRGDRRGAAQQRDLVLGDAAQDLGAPHLALDDLDDAQRRARERQAPAVDVEHRQRVQVAVGFAQAEAPADGGGVEPVAAVGEHDALGRGGRAGGVVDRRGRVLGDRRPLPPGVRGREELGVLLAVHDDAPRRGDGGEALGEPGVDEQQRGAGVVDDVLRLVGGQAEVDGHEDPAGAGGRVERDEQLDGVGRDDRDALARRDAQPRQRLGHPVAAPHQLAVGQAAQRARDPGLVDGAETAGMDGARPVTEVGGRQRDGQTATDLPAGGSPSARPAPRTRPANTSCALSKPVRRVMSASTSSRPPAMRPSASEKSSLV